MPVLRRTASCWERWEDSSPSLGISSPTERSSSEGGSRIRIRAGCPRVLKNSAFRLSIGSGIASCPSALEAPTREEPGKYLTRFDQLTIPETSHLIFGPKGRSCLG